MNDSFENKIHRIEIKNFTCFREVKLDFSPGINVIIGENGTGKTHLLKLLYMTADFQADKMILTNIKNLFKVEPHDLLRDHSKNSNIIVEKGSFSTEAVIISEDKFTPFRFISNSELKSNAVFIPHQEMLSWQEGFLSLYEKREVGFDQTYRDLALALDARQLKNSFFENAQKVVLDLEKLIDGKVVKKNRKFYIKFNSGIEHESSIVATGINKIGQLIYLIINGSITKDSILFWDEPEASLNPKYISVVSKFLQTLANWGVQIFVATHDYLLTHQLSLRAEYRDKHTPDMRFFSLYRTPKEGSQIEFGNTLPEIDKNSILDEFAKHYDIEEHLFAESLNEENEDYGKEN